MGALAIEFDWVEYSVFAFMLALSALIGVYYGFIKGQNTVGEYLLGNKKMGLFPITMSLISGFVSGNTIIGIPNEIYTYGMTYIQCLISYVTTCLLCAFVFTPVFYQLQVISVYEYMELRFNSKVRKMVSMLYALQLLVYLPVVIYGAALALNQVSGLNIYAMAYIVCGICIFYTSVGGLKAVVWTDALQTAIMLMACFVVGGIGTVQAGGFSGILKAAREGDRLQIFNFDPDPRVRVSFWNMLIGPIFAWTASSTVSPSAVQRFVSLDTFKKARTAVFWCHFGWGIFFVISCYMGLVLYANYKDCDPLATGQILRSDQILPFYILDATGKYRGLPGLFLAGVISAALSSLSAGLNTVSGTIYEDFIEPICGKTTEKKASNIMKVLSAVFGVICVILVFFMQNFGSLVELSNGFGGLTGGSILGIFILGMFFPQANSKGALVGSITGLGFLAWLVLGSRAAIARGDIVYAKKPISVDGCAFNLTGIDIHYPAPEVSGKVFFLYELSIFYFCAVGCFITVVVGLIVSYYSGPNKIEEVDRALLTPVIRWLLPEYKPVPVKDTELKQVTETALKQVIETELNQVNETELKQVIETELKLDKETELKQLIEAELKQDKETELKQVIETELKQDKETELKQINKTCGE